jgi:ppGpp synthetase/RelA/SpoT-type nucleotidyltranferase
MINIEPVYRQRFDTILTPLAEKLEIQLREYFGAEPRIDRVTSRAKSVDRFMAKAKSVTSDGTPKYTEPLRQIQDQVGARVITFYTSDIERVSQVILKYYRPIELREIVPDSEWEFGYFGKHFILLVPTELTDRSIDKALVPEFFEMQVKTLFQHAWSEANHDLGYKPTLGALDSDAKRRLAFTSAQAWGADRIFDELYRERTT